MHPELDLSRPRRVHVVAVGGSGMGPIATVLKAMGHEVSGSDLVASPRLERLAALGVRVHVGHHAGHVPDAVDALAVSTAVPDDNPEVVEARRRGVPVLTRAPVLRAICATRRVVAVAGTHGKTTTTAMLAAVLRGAGMRPSFIVGGDIAGLDGGAAWDDGAWFVLEADESDSTFLGLEPEVAVLTSVEPDHLEHHGGFDALVERFGQFLGSSAGSRLVCADDPGAARIGAAVGARTYGVDGGASVRLTQRRPDRSGQRGVLERDGVVLGEIRVAMPGLHNARNATAALAAALEIGVPFEAAALGLAGFRGVRRRFEHRGSVAGVTFVDDYAHLPTEVAAMVAAGREGDWERVVVVFQPHRYSRTESLWRDFGPAFDGADLLVVTDVYGAGEAPRPGVTGELVARAVRDHPSGPPVAYVADRAALVEHLVGVLRPGDLCLTLGAGDLTTLPDDLLAALGGPGA